MTAPKPKPPDYNVSAVIRGTDTKGNVGVAWNGEKGRISVKLFSFVQLTGSPDLFLTLFPRDEGPRTDGRPGPRTALRDRDEDIPF